VTPPGRPKGEYRRAQPEGTPMSRNANWLVPDWPVEGVSALMTTRHGGVSAAPFDSLNLGAAVNDDPGAVESNRARLARAVGATPVYLQQVHGTQVIRLAHGWSAAADASVTTQPGVACSVQVADCLPVLFAAPQGRGVGAAHAGWRGLAAGVLELTLQALCDAARCDASQVACWLGPCIGPDHFEVGADVLSAFGVAADGPSPEFVATSPGKWHADLAALARNRLRIAGVRGVHGGQWCTYADPVRFFSYRRDRVTGRMVACVWIER
jgi:polyphenol oxidase